MPKSKNEEVEEVVAEVVAEVTKKTKAHYVDNQKFLEELLEYFDKCKIAKEAGKELPRIPDYIGDCFMQIAENLSRKPNFINYSYREEMIMDGVENCLMYFRNFNPEKGKNPFSYFTQIIYYAFLRRISREKKQSYIKYKYTEQMGINDMIETPFDEADDPTQRQTHDALYDNMADYIHNFEEKVEEKRKKRKKSKEQQPEDE